MKFIEALKLKSKLFFLFILITLGLVSISVMGALNSSSMKKNLDSLYFGSLVPVTELNKILQTYHNGLTSTLYKSKNLELSYTQAIDELTYSLEKINTVWGKYESHYTRDEEVEYVEYVAVEIREINKYFLNIMGTLTNENARDKISIDILEKKISHIHYVIQQLINYEVNMAHYERKKFLLEYDNAVTRLSGILSLIILGVLLILYSVFSSIQADQTRLEKVTKKLKIVNQKLENVSYTDSLTNMHNRRYFNMIYSQELNRARRTHSYVTFMMLDIDYFKQYNDTYGHIKGDVALKAVAKVFKETLQRPSDFVFRLGGEEFGVLLTQVDESNSAKLARDICDAIRGKHILHATSKVDSYLTISIGVVCCIANDALNEDVLLSRADEMLYEAKDTGRNRYIITSNVSEKIAQKIDSLTA